MYSYVSKFLVLLVAASNLEEVESRRALPNLMFVKISKSLVEWVSLMTENEPSFCTWVLFLVADVTCLENVAARAFEGRR